MASTTSTTSTTKGPGLSCDNCRLRKVRCSRATPCSQCSHLDLPCLYSQVPRKRANPVRGRLIAQARDHSASLSSGLGHHSSPGPASHRSPASSHHHHQQYAGGGVDDEAHWSPRTNHSGTHEFAPEFFLNLLDDFEQVVFPFSPIITAAELTEIIRNHTNNNDNNNSTLEDEALIYAFAAVTTYLRNTDAVSQHSHEKDHLNTLLQLGLRAYRQIDLGDPRPPKDTMYPPLPGGGGGHDNSPLSSTLKRIITSIFIEISMMAFKSYDRSFALLREQVCMIQMIETNRRLQPRGVFPTAVYSSPRYMRIYWEVFIHERFLSINVGYPSILPPLSIGVPVPDPGIPLYIDVGFRRLIHLFTILDEAFLAHWHGMQQQQNGALDGAAQTSTLTLHWIETKQLQLDEDEQQAAQAEEEVSMQLPSTPSDSHTTTTPSPIHTRDSPRHATTTPSSSSSPFAPRDKSIRALQHIDQYVTRLWLRTLLWQLALSRGLLSSEPSPHSHEGLSLHFPAQWLSTQLRSLVDRLDSFAAINTQGTGVLQKLFEITSTIADVMALPLPSHNNGNAPSATTSASAPVPTPGSLNGLAGSPGSVSVGTDGAHSGGRGPHAADDEPASRATRMRDFATLVQFLLQFNRVRSEQREYLEEKLQSLDGLYDDGAGAGTQEQQRQQQQQQSSPYYQQY